MDVNAGTESYHAVHKKWHPIYRQLLYDRLYYDIFMIDMKGDMIYSAYQKLLWKHVSVMSLILLSDFAFFHYCYARANVLNVYSDCRTWPLGK